jgi:hypothetical protein
MLFHRIKTVSKPDPFERWDFSLSEEQTPHIVEKPKNRKNAMEPKEASCGLHTQEVAGSSPAAPTTTPIDLKRVVRSESHRFAYSLLDSVLNFAKTQSTFICLTIQFCRRLSFHL